MCLKQTSLVKWEQLTQTEKGNTLTKIKDGDFNLWLLPEAAALPDVKKGTSLSMLAAKVRETVEDEELKRVQRVGTCLSVFPTAAEAPRRGKSEIENIQ